MSRIELLTQDGARAEARPLLEQVHAAFGATPNMFRALANSPAAQIQGADVESLRNVGFTDGDVMEMMGHIALNLFTNYVNVAFAVPLDFPHVTLRAK
ncbi:alkylhydroperoxidase family enzyme [Janthinobacterium sp. CG_23.3]|uniref:hypothetical protein n=1 Tax=Janthinobacterium sp. CG_23.3 TaxID=3349634 RepID=UPI0038D4033E